MIALAPVLTSVAMLAPTSPAPAPSSALSALPSVGVSNPALVSASRVRCVKRTSQVYRGRRLPVSGLCGRHYSDRQIAAMLRHSGFPRRLLVDATATVLAESGGFDQAYRINRARSGRILSIDTTIWQLNSKWWPASKRIRPGDALAASRLARRIALAEGLDTWHGYAHRHAFLRRARAAVAATR